jgi:putative aldouronate transport system permease protein
MKTTGLSDNLLLIVFRTVLVLFGLACIIPFMILVSSSLTDEMTMVKHGYNLWPRKFSLEAYVHIFKAGTIMRAYGVTTFVTVVGTLMGMVVTTGIAYALASRRLRYAGAISLFMYITLLFSGGLVPYYILIVRYLKLKDTVWALILPGIFSPWFVYLLRNYFRSVPDSLQEAARIDGANDLQILVRIMLPVSTPALATIALFFSVGHWNEWLRALLFIEKEELYPLQYIIMSIIRNIDFARNMVRSSSNDLSVVMPAYSARMATAVLTIGPIIFLYPFMQRYFVKGLTMGGIKE